MGNCDLEMAVVPSLDGFVDRFRFFLVADDDDGGMLMVIVVDHACYIYIYIYESSSCLFFSVYSLSFYAPFSSIVTSSHLSLELRPPPNYR